jgi:hypothetical protein
VSPRLRVALLLLATATPVPLAAERARLERTHVVVDYDAAELDHADAEAFADLADKGVADLEPLLAPGLESRAAFPARVRFVISSRVEISRTRHGVVFLPLERVRGRRAPYLHETVHALLPVFGHRTWLGEGLACYMESWVSETRGGYDAHVFTRAGTHGIDAAARRTLASEAGRAVLPWVGGCGDPPALEQDRTGVARPFYVLSHSLTRHLVEQVGLATVVRFLVTDREDALPAAVRGATGGAWRRGWLEELLAAPFPSPSIDSPIPAMIRSCG